VWRYGTSPVKQENDLQQGEPRTTIREERPEKSGEGRAEKSGLGHSSRLAVPTAGPNEGLRRARAVAALLDDAITIPGTDMRVGLDPLIGLMPGIGDFVGGAVSVYIILEAARAGAPASVLVRMASTVGVDIVIGSIPVLGDLFDFGWKSNTRNVRLLERHVMQPIETKRASGLVVAAIAVGLATVTLGLATLVFLGVRSLMR
jgi:hypothetical protein